MSEDSASVTKIMSATPAEFLRSLTHFAPKREFSETAKAFHFPLETGEAVIRTKVLPDRAVTGLLGLPQLEVSLDFQEVPDVEKEKFLREFDLAFRRGGG